MPPDFSKSTSETLSRRAGSLCSNVECRVLTVGPTLAPDKSVNIGEAAHIYGARVGSARYRPDMTDISRSEVTNGIWLCAKCHKLIDSDPARYPAELLFTWRSVHDEFVTSKLGTSNDKLRLGLEASRIAKFEDDSELAKRIALDRPAGWEYRLTAELLRQYLKVSLRGWTDLQRNLYVRPIRILDGGAFFDWVQARNDEAARLLQVLSNLYSEELTRAWGELGVAGDAMEIRHVCKLIQSAAEQLLQWEESVRFIFVPDDYEGILSCLPGFLGIQLDELRSVPHKLDEVVDWIELNPTPGIHKRFEHTITFKPPEGWTERLREEFKLFQQRA